MRLLLFACMAAVALPAAAQQEIIRGEVAYTDVLRYDYTGDGKRNRIRFWLQFDGHSAVGKPGTPGYKPAAGNIRYFIRDEDDATKVVKWRGGLDMEGAPRDVPIPMSDLEFKGKTATFEAFGMRWTVTDGGKGYQKDKIVVNDGFRSTEMTNLRAGDIWVGPAK